jgi:hypothetical protein
MNQNEVRDVSWPAVRPSVRGWLLVKSLMIDDEWLIDGTNELSWWPWLP